MPSRSTVVDDANKTIASYTVNADGDTVAVASTDIKSGSTYKVTVNGTTTEVTAGTGLTEGMAGGGPAGGMRSNGDITMSGGTVEAMISSSPDNEAVDLDGTLTFTGGTMLYGGTGTGATFDNAYVKLPSGVKQGDKVIVISGGKIAVTSSYEGMQANEIDIDGGETTISSTDDAVNASGSYKTPILNITAGKLVFLAGGDGLDTIKDGLVGHDSVHITDGTVNVSAGDDAIESNQDNDENKGLVEITGGDVTVATGTEDGNHGISAERKLSSANNSINLIDGGTIADTDEEKAAIYATHDLTFKGDGVVAINGDSKDAVYTKDDLKIKSGTVFAK
ncbi:carbohydrate-binding domain-containing protein [Weissella confusa]|uniref:Carbohydrate-binding domain-containing protein n=1 Tax=Weissella confusa TaxID=1583 RepID=A0A923NGX0_WEICO|nr:carbohydrate-binding domain-containing protein [Weissella confusa]